jgi:hypothetical protein
MLMIRDRIDIISKLIRVSKNEVLTTTVHMKTKYFLKTWYLVEKKIGWKSLTLFIEPIYSEVTNLDRELFLIFLYYSFRDKGHLITIYNGPISYILCLIEVLENDQTFAKIEQ